MKTMCPPGHHQNGFVATHALGFGHMIYSYDPVMFMNSSPFHCSYCFPLFYICGYFYVGTTALLKVKDI